MKKNFYCLSCCFLISFYACSSDSEEDVPGPDGNTVDVEIITDIATRATVITQFADGAEMNVFAKTYNKPDAPDMEKDIKGTYKGAKWILSPSVRLKEGERTFMYAFSPYTEQLSDLTRIPINISEQKDVLYSGSSVPVSYTTYQAKLTMKHALSLMTLNIINQGYSAGKGNLQSISVAGENVYTSGSLNIENGKIIGNAKNKVSVAIGKLIVTNGWTNDLPRMWVIPFNTKAETAKLTVRIDNKDFEAMLPEVEMKGGYQYIFRLVLTDSRLVFIPDQTQVISLNQETDQIEELKGHGVLQFSYTGNDFIVPTLTGDNVFGSINWGDGSNDSYVIHAHHPYAAADEKTIIIESWNSEGFKLDNLKGIELIDVSQY